MRANFGFRDLAKVLADLPMTCLDVGARDGIVEDLLPIAAAVDAYGFEPDTEECQRLMAEAARGTHPWRSLRFLPVALGKDGEHRTLNIYRHRGGSSILEADLELLRRYSREGNFILDGQIELSTRALDDAAAEYGCSDAVYLKLDIQGLELEVLESASQMLEESILAIRCEVEFIPSYSDQPLFHEIDAYLHGYGFLPMGFVQPRHWRRDTRRQLSFGKGPVVFSRGQIAHADVVYFRDPMRMADDSTEEIRNLLRAALIALAYECVDHAAAIFEGPRVSEYLRDAYGVDRSKLLAVVSRTLARRHRITRYLSGFRDLGEAFAQSVCSLVGRPLNVTGRWPAR
jgi:FkbM family methyltransferase